MAARRGLRWLGWLGIPVLVIAVAVALFRWDWLIPVIEPRVSAALGRPVTLAHLHVRLGRVTEISADDVRIANPEGFPADPPFAHVDRLTARVDVMQYIHGRHIVIPLIQLDKPHVQALADAKGHNNYTFDFGGPSGETPNQAPPSPGPQIGALVINDGAVHAKLDKQRADFNLAVNTRQPEGKEAQIVVDARGTYAAQPITGQLVGGALLSLRDHDTPWPVQLRLANGPTHVALNGTLADPLNFRGARLKLEFAGPDMSLLFPLTGVPIPETPPYSVTGNLDYVAGRVRFTDFAGKLGSSDIGGTITVSTGGARPDVTADLRSRRVDLADLGGFIGSQPGRTDTPGQTAQQRREVARAESSPRMLPDTPINLPKVRAADVHLRYDGQHIEGRHVPFDNIRVALDINDGAIEVHPVSFRVGQGTLSGTFAFKPEANDVVHTTGEIRAQRLDVGRLMQATGVFGGAGTISGGARIDTTGNSVATMLGRGNGGLNLSMRGGDLSSLLVDLSGLQFGQAILSALGIPRRSQVECLVADYALQRGVLETRTLLLDTESDVLTGKGSIDLAHEKIDYQLRTDSKHFSIGSLPGPINLGGTFRNPSILPGAEVAARGGAAIGLGILAGPLALLPTIEFGVGDSDECAQHFRQQTRHPTPASRSR